MYFFDFHSHLDWYKNDKQNSLLSSNSSALINQRFYDSAYYADLLSQLENFSGTIISASCNEESFYENLKICEKANIISRKSGQKIQKIANLQYYKSKANYGTKEKGISR